MNACWTSHEGADGLYVNGASAVVVRVAGGRAPATSPGMSGRCVPANGGVCFLPRFSWMAGTTYTVEVDGEVIAELTRPAVPGPPEAEVVGIWPSASVVPRNLLRFYVQFSAPMSEGLASAHLALIGGDGRRLEEAFFSMDQELWDGERRRVTVLLDPARIKQGLVPHLQLGYPLVEGQGFRLVVGAGFEDASGRRLVSGSERSYRVGADVRERVDPAKWTLEPPEAGTSGELRVGFGRALDYGLLRRCLHVVGDGDGGARRVAGRAVIGEEERSWAFRPAASWQAGSYRLIVDPVLEDVAGNSVRRIFDRDLSGPQPDAEPPTEVTFEVQDALTIKGTKR